MSVLYETHTGAARGGRGGIKKRKCEAKSGLGKNFSTTIPDMHNQVKTQPEMNHHERVLERGNEIPERLVVRGVAERKSSPEGSRDRGSRGEGYLSGIHEKKGKKAWNAPARSCRNPLVGNGIKEGKKILGLLIKKRKGNL